MTLLGSAGSIAMSRMLRLPLVSPGTLLAVVTVSLVKVGDPLMAFVDRYRPRTPRGGDANPTEPPLGLPPVPVYVDANTMFGSVGCTRIWLITRPVNASTLP